MVGWWRIQQPLTRELTFSPALGERGTSLLQSLLVKWSCSHRCTWMTPLCSDQSLSFSLHTGAFAIDLVKSLRIRCYRCWNKCAVVCSVKKNLRQASCGDKSWRLPGQTLTVCPLMVICTLVSCQGCPDDSPGIGFYIAFIQFHSVSTWW